MDGVLTRSMEMELDQLVVGVSDREGVALRIVDLDGMAVIDFVGDVLVMHDLQLCRTEIGSEFRQRGRRSFCDIDRRLVTALIADRKDRIEFAPESRTFFAFVRPVWCVG